MQSVSFQYLTKIQFILSVIVFASAITADRIGTAEEACLFDDPCLPLVTDSACDDLDSCCGCSDQGCLSPTRTALTGDWGGHRSGLAESGITFQADVTQFYFGVVDGGVDRSFRYSGHGDYVLNVDAGKLGLQEGLFVKVRAEHRFGEAFGGATGALLPSTLQSDLPDPENEELILTNVIFTQALSENFIVFAGKIDTLDGDANAFAHGRGKTQFSNVGFVANPIALRSIPYSSLGGGFAWLENGEPIFTFTIMNPTETITTSGFDELFAEGVAMAAELRIPTNFLNKPGHQLVAATWNSREYVALGQDPRIVLPNVPIVPTTGSWSLYWNFDQHLVVDRCDSTKGWGVFGRAGIADDDSNPLSYFLSAGVGGNSPISGRSNDTFGAGWYYSASSGEIGPLLNAALGPIGDGQGVELFYRAEVTPWFHITPDVQVIVPAREQVDTAYVLGLRSNISF